MHLQNLNLIILIIDKVKNNFLIKPLLFSNLYIFNMIDFIQTEQFIVLFILLKDLYM
jgi:hypothetical protein